MGKDQDLLEACRTGNVAAVEKLLAAKIGSTKSKGSKGAGGGALSLPKGLLINLKCANVNCADTSGGTPLHLAALNGHQKIVSILLDLDANTSALDSQDCSPLHLGAWGGHAEICRSLLKSGDGHNLINLQTRDGNTALHFAAQHGHSDTLSLLLQANADPTIRNLGDFSPLDLAAHYDRLVIVKQLVTSHPELLTQRSGLNTPLHLASRNGNRAVVQYLLDSGFPVDAKTDKGSALHEAANSCKLDVIKLLLDKGVDISVRSQTGCTAEDILRSIPSKTGVDALDILKAHIFHQRTPDSDGEKGLVDDQDPEQQTPNVPIQHSPAQPRSLPPKKVPHLSTSSLPSSSDLEVPPPLPPRQSMMVVDMPRPVNRPGIKVALEKPVETPDDENSVPSGSPREASPCTRSPGELPVKPPRRKPCSFKRTDQTPPMADVYAVPNKGPLAGSNYINLDPNVELHKVDARMGPADETDHTQTGASFTEIQIVDGAAVQAEAGVQRERSGCVPEPEVTVPQQEDLPKNAAVPPSSLEISSAGACTEPTTTVSPTQVQPATPDCPPPSPSTALQDIQRKIPPMEKRKSQDVETLTDNTAGVGLASSPLSDDPLDDSMAAPHMAIYQGKILTPVTEEVCNVAGGRPVSSSKLRDSDHLEAMLTHPENLPDPAEPQDSLPSRPLSEDMAGGRPMPPRTKPKPLPRKSSLSSESVDLYPQEQPIELVAGSDVAYMEGYGGARPISSGGYKVFPQHSGIIGADGQLADPGDVIEPAPFNSAIDNVGIFVDTGGDVVQMRRSVSAGSDPREWEGHVFSDLLRGSVIGGARSVVNQPFINNVNARKKRKSTPSNFVTFDPVMEEDKDIDPEKILSEIDNIGLTQQEDGMGTEENLDDDSEEWAQIRATFEEFGVGISRESVFMQVHEANFTKFISAGKVTANFPGAHFGCDFCDFSSNLFPASFPVPANFPVPAHFPEKTELQGVGEWLSSIHLPQYENTLVANGYDDTDFLGGNIMEDQDLNAIGIEEASHRQKILEEAAKLPMLQPIDPNSLPESVAEWLGSLRLDFYLDTFNTHKYDTMDRLVKLWELELITVLDITSIGHRKRILASLGDRWRDASNTITKNRTPMFSSLAQEVKSPFDNVDLYRDYSGTRSRIPNSGPDEVVASSLDQFDSNPEFGLGKGRSIRDNEVHIRAPHVVQYTGSIKQWRHKPEILIKGCCNYTAHYLGSTLVKELKGAKSTQEGIAKLKHRLRRKLQKSTEVINKIPSIMLSISFKGVKFIDATSKKVVCDHEIGNIFCACQDGEHMNFFAYITKDREVGKHYCHVFSVRTREEAGEIILTLGEAFEIAYQMVLKEKAEREAEEFEKLSVSDGDDSTSVSSKASVNTV